MRSAGTSAIILPSQRTAGETRGVERLGGQRREHGLRWSLEGDLNAFHWRELNSL
jgi:hypothetical protein